MNNEDGKKPLKAQEKADKCVKSFVTNASAKSDPFGSYTGHVVKDSFGHEKPVQDSDDL